MTSVSYSDHHVVAFLPVYLALLLFRGSFAAISNLTFSGTALLELQMKFLPLSQHTE